MGEIHSIRSRKEERDPIHTRGKKKNLEEKKRGEILPQGTHRKALTAVGTRGPHKGFIFTLTGSRQREKGTGSIRLPEKNSNDQKRRTPTHTHNKGALREKKALSTN